MPEVREKGFKMPSLSYIALFAVPAFLYLITNNLGVQMQTEMDPATYQVGTIVTGVRPQFKFSQNVHHDGLTPVTDMLCHCTETKGQSQNVDM